LRSSGETVNNNNLRKSINIAAGVALSMEIDKFMSFSRQITIYYDSNLIAIRLLNGVTLVSAVSKKLLTSGIMNE